MSNSDKPPPEDYIMYRGRGYGRGRGRRLHRGIGRPPVAYPIEIDRRITRNQISIELTSFELQILQLSDIEGLTQQEIAEKLKISQTSVWRYLKSIRLRLADAISKHNQINIIIVD